MKTVIQIVEKATLSVNNEIVSEIGKGLVVYLGIHFSDTKEKAEKLATKIANLRIFKDESGKINLSVQQAGNNILLVSNFTLYADATRGNRPNFSYAMEPKQADEIYKHFIKELSAFGINVKTGVFGASMKINQLCLGPVNIVLEMW